MLKRISSINSLSPEERHNCLIAEYPDIVQRVPQHLIASFISLKH